MNSRQLNQPPIKVDGLEKKEFQNTEPSDDGKDYLADSMALRAFRAVLDPRHYPDRTAALAMWQRIVDTDLATARLGVEEQQFIQTVAAKMIGADKLDAKKRPDAVLAASGLYGKHQKEVDTLLERIWSAYDDFESLSTEPSIPTVASKTHTKRNMFLAIFAQHPEIMRKVLTPENLRRHVEEFRDKRRKK